VSKGTPDDTVAPVERVDQPTAASVEADMSWPPENVADADVINRHLGQL
jgi:hypothetical protein